MCNHPNVSDLSVWLRSTNSVSCIEWSDPRKKKWDPGFHEHIDPLPLPPPASLLPTHLWQCNSRISCSLSKWADWMDVFPLHDPFHTEGTNRAEKSFHFVVAHFALNVFTDWAFTALQLSTLMCSWDQSANQCWAEDKPPLSTLYYLFQKRSACFSKYWQAIAMETDQMWCQISDLRYWSALIGSDELFRPSCSLITLSVKANVCSG